MGMHHADPRARLAQARTHRRGLESGIISTVDNVRQPGTTAGSFAGAVMKMFARYATWLAAACCVLAIAAFAAALDGYSHAQHPLGLLGASGMPRAMAFNLLGFVLPGTLLAIGAVSLRGALPVGAGRTAGVGTWLLALSALAFAAQGLMPLDSGELDGPASRLHATAWTIWWIAFVPAALLLAMGLAAAPQWRLAALLLLVCAIAVLLAALPPVLLPGPVAQRAGLAAWLLAYLVSAGAQGRKRLPDGA